MPSTKPIAAKKDAVQVVPASGRKALREVLFSFLSPGMSEAGAAIADQVRLYRWKRAVSIMEKAKEFASERGLKKTQVPIKFLVPFIESASNEDDDLMEERWARLLASTMGNSFDSTNRMVLECLSKMGRREALLLKKFGIPSDGGAAPFMSAIGGYQLVDFKLIQESARKVLSLSTAKIKHAIKEQSTALFKEIVLRGGMPVLYAVFHEQLGSDDQAVLQRWVATCQAELLTLSNLDLISSVDIDEVIDGVRVRCIWFQLTALGQAFLVACEDDTPFAPGHLNSDWFKQMDELDIDKTAKPKPKRRTARKSMA